MPHRVHQVSTCGAGSVPDAPDLQAAPAGPAALRWRCVDFDALQQRMTTSKAKLASLVRERPASFAAFDLLAAAGHDIRGVPLSGRGKLLEALAVDCRTVIPLPATKDRELAKTWFEEMPATGIEGLVINSLLNESVDAGPKSSTSRPCWSH